MAVSPITEGRARHSPRARRGKGQHRGKDQADQHKAEQQHGERRAELDADLGREEGRGPQENKHQRQDDPEQHALRPVRQAQASLMAMAAPNASCVAAVQ